MSTIFAWTAPGSDYPEYLNVSDADDEAGRQTISITVRGPKTGDKCGDVATITLSAGEWAMLVGHLNFHFATRLPL